MANSDLCTRCDLGQKDYSNGSLGLPLEVGFSGGDVDPQSLYFRSRLPLRMDGEPSASFCVLRIFVDTEVVDPSLTLSFTEVLPETG